MEEMRPRGGGDCSGGGLYKQLLRATAAATALCCSYGVIAAPFCCFHGVLLHTREKGKK